MTNTKFAIITPSYAPDYHRCKLLCESMDKHSSNASNHYVVVDKKDYKLFSCLQSSNRQVITVESVLPWWIIKSPFKNGWFSFKSIPLRNWIVQQLVKLSMAEIVEEDILIFVDSDVVFVKNFSLNSFIQGDRVRLFREPAVVPHESELGKWTNISTNLLKIPAVDFPASNYLGNFIVWKRDNVLALYQHLEQVHGKNWLEVIANSWHLSEYILYGVFVEYVLGETSNHYYDDRLICHNYWDTTPMSNNKIKDFFSNIPQQCFAVMVSAKSDTKLENLIPYVM